MPLDLNSLAPTPGTGIVSKRSGRTSGPNPFLDNGWLEKSYEEGQDYELTVPGTIEPYISEKDGKERTRVTGDAGQVISMIRSASNKLGIGVAIQYEPAPKRKGQILIRYLGQERRAYTRGAADAEPEDEDTEE